MQELGELIFEGAINSYEAGASEVYISLEEEAGIVKVLVKDNGFLLEKGDFFAKGFSTKGFGRGGGLSKIKEVDERATLSSQEDWTVLAFRAKSDSSLEKLEDILFPIFQFPIKLGFSYYREGKEVLSIEGEGGIARAKEIALFKDLVRSKIRSV